MTSDAFAAHLCAELGKAGYSVQWEIARTGSHYLTVAMPVYKIRVSTHKPGKGRWRRRADIYFYPATRTPESAAIEILRNLEKRK